MQIDVFSFDHYKPYLLAVEKQSTRGFRARLASAARCRSPYISQVLGGEAHLAPEHAEGISNELGHDDKESDYFLLLVQWARSGTEALQKRYSRQIRSAQQGRKRLRDRLSTPSLDQAAQRLYYGSWKYAAVHVALSIPDLHRAESISRALNIPIAQVNTILNDLEKMGLVAHKENRLTLTQMRLHLEDDSPQIVQHHSNWRRKAVESLDRSNPSDFDRRLHYSSVVTISEQDVDELRHHLLKSIEFAKKVIRKSPEERIYGLNCDFFPL